MKRLLVPALLAATLHAHAADPAEGPLNALPYTPSLDTTVMDRSADPCEDLYRYACGGWSAQNPIPADQSRWSVYAKMANENQRYLWGVLDKLGTASERSASQAKLGDYFAASTTQVTGNTINRQWEIKRTRDDYEVTTEELKKDYPAFDKIPTEKKLLGR